MIPIYLPWTQVSIGGTHRPFTQSCCDSIDPSAKTNPSLHSAITVFPSEFVGTVYPFVICCPAHAKTAKNYIIVWFDTTNSKGNTWKRSEWLLHVAAEGVVPLELKVCVFSPCNIAAMRNPSVVKINIKFPPKHSRPTKKACACICSVRIFSIRTFVASSAYSSYQRSVN